MIFYKTNKKSAYDMAESMNDILINKTASDNKIDNDSEKLINALNRSSELFEDLQNYKAAEIIIKVIEKIAGK